MYENQLLATVTQMAATLDAIRLELDALVGLLDHRLAPLPTAMLPEVPGRDGMPGAPASGPPVARAEEVA